MANVDLAELEETKTALRIDTDDDDGTLAILISAASRAVISYLKDQAEVLIDFDTDGDVSDVAEVDQRVKLATIVLTGYYYRAPDHNPDSEFQHGMLPFPVTALLYDLRDPTLA